MNRIIFSKYKRGDVWFIKLKDENGDNIKGSSVQKKSRPYVIVSCEQNNNNAPVLQVIPIATMHFDHLPCHVYYRNADRDQIVMCEQITTLSIQDFQREGSRFLYSFNLDFMNEIDEALAGQLGLRTRVADMKVLENLIKKITANRELELKKKYENNMQARVEKIAQFIAEKFGISLDSQDVLTGVQYNSQDLKYVSADTKNEMSKAYKERTTSPELSEKPISSENNSKLINTSNFVETQVSKKRNTWTTESMKQFLDDKQKLTLQELSEKYDIKKKSIATLAWSFKKKLGGNDTCE